MLVVECQPLRRHLPGEGSKQIALAQLERIAVGLWRDRRERRWWHVVVVRLFLQGGGELGLG